MNAVTQNYNPNAPRQSSPIHHPSQSRRSNSRLPWLIGGGIATVLVILVLAVGLWSYMSNRANAIGAVESNHYQAVFLTNNQVYFGKIKSISGSTVKLTNIYYLQASQTTPQNSNNPQQSQNNQNLSLVKLGSELHGPEDVMYVDRKQVLFWENLKDDGKVVQAIKSNQSK